MVTIVTLIVLGSLLIFAEILLPGMIAGSVGALCFLGAIVSGYKIYDGATPHYIAFAIVGIGLVEFLIWLWWFPRSSIGKALISKGAIGKLNERDPSLQGQQGVAITDLRPSGAVRMAGGSKLDVVSEGGMILAGASVKVVEADGVRIVVRQID